MNSTKYYGVICAFKINRINTHEEILLFTICRGAMNEFNFFIKKIKGGDKTAFN